MHERSHVVPRVLSHCEYPPLLSEIADPPQTLYLRGSLPPASHKLIAVVGSRRYTPYGKQVCELLVRGLSGMPVAIVSGLALGIDGIAHEAALAAGLYTIAVPGSGLDERVLYPRAHRALALRIVESGGGLLSEFEPSFRARPESFPQRNRIMAGMSHAVLVIEAEVKSGTLITSRLATDYNRDVLAVPGPISSATSGGPHLLIRKGAALIRSSDDILEALGLDAKERQASLPFDLSPEEGEALALLEEPRTRDEFASAFDRPIQTTNITLASLELKGVIVERMGKLMRIRSR